MAELIGKTLLNRYRVDSFVGRGGMAEVYKVWDQHRAVFLAMKLLREELAEDKVFLRRFRRESQNLAQLQHPHIVRSYGLELEGRLAFLLMDYVEGSSLRGEIYDSDVPLSSRRVMEIMGPVCSALHYAHQMGMVHCDVKPSNIMIQKNGTVLLADFGIARMTDDATATMVGAGTPAYMAPEQVRGENPAPQTDIYALGVVLYEMLTGGGRPFTGEHAQTTGSTSEKVRWEQMHLAAPSPRRYNPAISPELEAVVLKCLAKEPHTRYSSALDLLNALGQAMPEPGELRVESGVGGRPAQAKRQEPGPVGAASSPSPLAARGGGGEVRQTPAWFWVLTGVAVVGVLVIALVLINSGARPMAIEEFVPATNTILPSKTFQSDAKPTASIIPTLSSNAIVIAAIATVDANPEVYDNFNNPEYDGFWNMDQWEGRFSPPSEISQREGILTIANAKQEVNQQIELFARKYKSFKLTKPIFFQSDLFLASDNSYGNVSIGIITEEGDWASQCQLTWENNMSSPGANCWDIYWPYQESHGYSTEMKNIKFNEWHTVRIEIDADKMVFSYFIDGKLYGKHKPVDADRLIDKDFTIWVWVWKPGSGDTVIGKFDNILIGSD